MAVAPKGLEALIGTEESRNGVTTQRMSKWPAIHTRVQSAGYVEGQVNIILLHITSRF